jgi:hypothetical protein
MTAFCFDAEAALRKAREGCHRPNLPNRPNRGEAECAGLGGLGTVHASGPEISPDELARDIFEERAAIREYDGGQERAESERAAWIEAKRAAGIKDLDD